MPLQNRFAFKGGTCLSKAYNLIQRFSEDIDLILDWRVLGYRMTEPWDVRVKPNRKNLIERQMKEPYYSCEIFASSNN